MQKALFHLLFTKRNILIEFDANSFHSFKEYFDYVIKEPLWIYQDSTGKITKYELYITY